MNSRPLNVGIVALGVALLSLPVLSAVIDRNVSTGAVLAAALGAWCVIGGTVNLLARGTSAMLTRVQTVVIGGFFFAIALAVVAIVGLAVASTTRVFEIALFVSGDILILAFLGSIVLLVRRWVRGAA